jgi:hypothetical protein
LLSASERCVAVEEEPMMVVCLWEMVRVEL